MIRRLRGRLRDQRGSVLVIAVMVLSLMMMLGATALSTVDTQSDVSKRERHHESTFNLAEGTLNTQTYVLGRLGTGSVDFQFPSECTNASNDPLCPDSERLLRSYDAATQNDFKDPVWKTKVRDNPSGTYYDPALVHAPANPRYDANGDRQLWVTAEATVRGRTRTIVALIKVELRHIEFPRFALLGGWFETTNTGRKTIVRATGSLGSLGIGVRCSAPPKSPGCLDYDPKKGQLEGGYELGYPTQPAISKDDLQALEDYAKASGTYYTSCPSNPNGAVVVVESGNCAYNDNTPAAPGMSKCCNTPSKPGLLIIKSGTLVLTGGIQFYGLVYMPNLQNSSGVVVESGGTAVVYGGVVIDGPGGMAAGGSALAIEFASLSFDDISTAGTAGVVQNTWREVPDDN